MAVEREALMWRLSCSGPSRLAALASRSVWWEEPIEVEQGD